MSPTLPNGEPGSNGSQQPPCPLRALAEQRRLPVEAFTDHQVRPAPEGKVVFPVYDRDRQHLYDVVRNPPGTEPPCYVKRGTTIVPYGRWRLPPPAHRLVLWLVEGYTDTLTLWRAGLVALGVHSAHHAQTLDREDLDGFAVLVVVREPDRGGDFLIPHLTEHVRQLVPDAQLWEVRMPDGIKDVSALWMDDPLRFGLRLAEAFENRTLLYPCGYSVNGAASPAGPAAARPGPGEGAVLGKTRSSADPPPDPSKTGPLPKKVGEPTGPADEDVPGRAFVDNDYRLQWMVQRLLVKGQPAVIGGAKKCLKTTLAVDLVASLAGGVPFLGHFKVYRPHNVLMISGESGEATLQETFLRVCEAKGLNPRELPTWWRFRMPQLADPLARTSLCKRLRKIGPEGVVIIDPLYLCLTAGLAGGSVQASNLYDIGPLLVAVAAQILDTGWTPILCHHARKGSAKDNDPMDLDELAFAGVAEFARQWLLVKRRKPFELGSGFHQLSLTAGGSAGGSGFWGLDVDEGTVGADDADPTAGFRDRRWGPRVLTAAELRGLAGERAEADKADKARAREDKLMQLLDQVEQLPEGGWVSRQALKDACGFNTATMDTVVAELERRGLLEVSTQPIPGGPGKKASREGRVVRRADPWPGK